MVNLYSAKKYGASFLTGMLPVILFILGLVMLHDLFIGIILMFFGIFVGIFVSRILTKHAFTEMMEGKGLCTFTLDSTGLLTPFITALDKPYIHGKVGKNSADGIYNRDMVTYLGEPQKSKLVKIPGKFTKDGKDKLFLELPNDFEKSDQLFRFDSYPTFIYNGITNSYMSKDSLSTFEKDIFTKNNSLHILKQTQRLSKDVRDFARYIVEHAKPNKFGILGNKWVLIAIAIVMIVIFILLFGGPILSVIGGTASNAGGIIPSGGGPIN